MWIDDQIILDSEQPLTLKVFVPDQTMIVLGRSNVAEQECFVDVAKAAKVPVLQRFGGGGTVVLYPGCLVISIGAWVSERFRNDYFFKILNQGILDLIAEKSPNLAGCLHQKGISDLTVDSRKFGGTSLFRSRNYLLFQASLLIDLDLSLIDKFLRHPTREPDYREGRKHADFLVGLSQECKDVTPKSLEEHFHQFGQRLFEDKMKEDLTAVQVEQRPHLLRKVADQKN